MNQLQATRLLSIVFFLSGLSSLIYQVVWQRVLTLHYGVGPVSITLIVSVYMFGLGFGALVGGRIAERFRDRIGIYMALELLLGGFGFFSLSFIGWLGGITAGTSYPVAMACMFALLAFPTFLMGMTLPVLVKAFSELSDDFLGNVSRLYFLNTLGAAVGALLASYVLISFMGLDVAVWVAAGMNLLLAALVARARNPVVSGNAGQTSQVADSESAYLGWIAYPAVFLSGFLAIGYEIVWFRIIGVITKASAYAFSTTLAVYLLGIALGSWWMGRFLARRSVDRRSLFFLLQFSVSLLSTACFLTYYFLMGARATRGFRRFAMTSFANVLHPNPDISGFLDQAEYLKAVMALTDVFLWPIFFMLIPTILMGASFPLIAYLAQSRRHAEGQTVGQVYFFNTVGNVLGGLVTGFVLLTYLGTEQTLLIFAVAGAFFLLFATSIRGRPLGIGWRALVFILFAASLWSWFPARTELYRTIHPARRAIETFVEEGASGVVVTGYSETRLFTYINGLAHGGRPNASFYVEAMETAALARRVETALVIGYGTGSVTEALLKLDELQNLTLVEINPVLLTNLRKLPLFREMLADDRIQLVVDDGRKYLLQTTDSYDLIIMDPLRTTTSHSNNIYSKEFFEMVRARLNPGGAFGVWGDEFRVLPKTIASVFEFVRMYDFYTVASDSPMIRDEARYARHLSRFSPEDREGIAESQGTYLGDRAYVESIAADYPINEDVKPVCEFYLGLWAKEWVLGLDGASEQFH
jgi:predicted membrane-bound spermidine synthase